MSDSGYCVFWDEVCTIHDIKPRMCKQWPFIGSVLQDPINWQSMHTMCPGIKTDVDMKKLQAYIQQVLKEFKS